jgi:hypothetical protein
MNGTVARTRVEPEDREKLGQVLERQSYQTVPCFQTSYILWQEDSDAAWLFAIFEGRAAYEKNADDPAQHERYLEYSALLQDEPEWHDRRICSKRSHHSGECISKGSTPIAGSGVHSYVPIWRVVGGRGAVVRCPRSVADPWDRICAGCRQQGRSRSIRRTGADPSEVVASVASTPVSGRRRRRLAVGGAGL